MGVKWAIAGAESIVKIYPGAGHGFMGWNSNAYDETRKLLEDSKLFIQERTK